MKMMTSKRIGIVHLKDCHALTKGDLGTRTGGPISVTRFDSMRITVKTLLTLPQSEHLYRRTAQSMGKGNVNKAAQKRERNAKKVVPKKGTTSQLKVNEKAKSIVCKVCLQTFLCTASSRDLQEHAENRHCRSSQECFD
jgi:hypothetical protein